MDTSLRYARARTLMIQTATRTHSDAIRWNRIQYACCNHYTADAAGPIIIIIEMQFRLETLTAISIHTNMIYILGPVSYTHLDVYKRQALCTITISKQIVLLNVSKYKNNQNTN